MSTWAQLVLVRLGFLLATLSEFYFLDAPGCDLTVSLTLMYHEFFPILYFVLLAFRKTQGFRPAFIKLSCQLRGL
jgi:hypothetical protein